MKSYFVVFLCFALLFCSKKVEANNEIVRVEQSENNSDVSPNCGSTIYHQFWDVGCYQYSWNNQVYTTGGDFTQNFVTDEGCDSVVILHLTMYMPTEYEFHVSTCGPYTRNGITYTESGTYHQPFYAPGQCDSIVTIHLTIKPVYNITINDVVCEDHIYNNHGFIVSSVGQQSPIIRKKYLTSTVYGCDSIITLNLTIIYPQYYERDVTACGSYTWNGVTYYESDSYTNLFPNVQGCDSIVTINLTILPNSSHTIYDNACNSYTWYGNTYTQSGAYQHTLNNSIGCDSILTLQLTIFEDYNLEIYDSICQGQTYIGHGFNVPTAGLSGLITRTIDFGSTSHDCDSVKTLYLTVHEPYNDTIDITSCGPHTWNSQVYPVSGYFRQFFTDKHGCDSIVTLNLTVAHNQEEDIYLESCGPIYHWGVYYIQTGVFPKHFTTVHGCDSLVRLHLTVYPPVLFYTYDTIACGNPFYWEGNEYTQPGNYTETLTSSHGCDSVVTLRILGFQDFAYGEFSHIACGSYTWQGITYTQSGNYVQPFPRPGLCDSLVTLHLTILRSEHYVIDEDACLSFTYNGQTYTQSGQYFQNFTNTIGCDSVYEINVRIHPNYHPVIYDSICRGEIYDKYNFSINTTGMSGIISRTQMLQSIYECDSIVTLHLTVLPVYHKDIIDDICKGEIYNNHGFYINTSTLNGVHTESLILPTIDGCDSVIALILTIHPSYDYEIPAPACDSLVWNGQVYTTPGIYTQYFETATFGCDSIVTKIVTINETKYREFDDQGCGFYTWFGVTYSTSGEYRHTLSAANGCDSILILHLTIHKPYNSPRDTVHSCGPYVWDGQTYTISGEYSRPYISQVTGCDSIVNKVIFIHNSYPTVVPLTSCGPYTWNGEVYTQSGVYSQTFTNAYGCDSVVNLILTVDVFAEAGIIVGPTTVFVATDTYHGIFDYYVTGVDYANGYVWEISNPQWIVEPNGKNCKLYVTTSGHAVLTVKAAGDCSSEEATIDINAIFGIEDFDDNVNISIYPNPTNGKINIKFEGLQGKIDVKIIDNVGKTLDYFTTHISSDNEVFSHSLEKFNKGMYFFVISDSKKTFVSKVVVQ